MLFAGNRQAIKEEEPIIHRYIYMSYPLCSGWVFPIDVAMVVYLHLMKRYGLGISVDYTLQAIKSAKTVIAEVNPNMPRTGPTSMLPVQEFDYFVEVDTPLLSWNLPLLERWKEPLGSILRI